ncbi:alpha/beta hydrolase [Actinospica robiniae]|uniref:alpha/beta hydrolase n=1 Tax=Actinospica robiniae TaxID=304901 RepID=UPI0004259507|nr:alpha/beta hydrolase [Actinospica robiniae]
MPDMVSAGYRVIVPNLIGSGLSDKPRELDHYAAGHVAADLAALLDKLGIDRVHLVGHGWGARFCWQFAMTHPFRIGAMVVVSAGHPKARSADNLFSLARARWDWVPFSNTDSNAAELYTAADCAYARLVFGSHPELQDVLARNLGQDGGFGPTLRWDPANPVTASWFQALTDTTAPPEVHAPVLGIWPTGDIFCFEHEVEASGQYVNGPFRYERVEAASHWAPSTPPVRSPDSSWTGCSSIGRRPLPPLSDGAPVRP